MSLAVVASSARTSLARYSRSLGLWILLLVAPIGARFMVAPRGADQSIITIADRVPWLTSPVLGVALGVVITTLLLPVAFIYLRANVNRRQPWQVEETTPASRVGVAYGRWLADLAVLAAVLAATTAAGCLLCVLLLPLDEVDALSVVWPLWVIALPPLALVAGLRILFDARPWLRGPLGEVLFFFVWMGGLIMAMLGQNHTGFAANMSDLDGFMSPLLYAQGAGGHAYNGNENFAIGGNLVPPGSAPIHIDVMTGLLAPGYLSARLAWFAIAALIPLAAGLVYAPHVAGKTRRQISWLRWLEPARAAKADPNAGAARPAALGWLNLLLAEMRLIAPGRTWLLCMVLIAAAGAVAPYHKAIGPASMLLLVFAATAHAGRSEQTGLQALTRTGTFSPMTRRVLFVLAGTLLTLLMGAGAIARALMLGQTGPLVEAAALGAGTSLAAIGLGALTHSATAPRLVLLIAWYGYLNG